MSLREILNLTQIVGQEDKHFTTRLFGLLVSVLIQVSDLAVEYEVVLEKIHAFEYITNEWAIALM